MKTVILALLLMLLLHALPASAGPHPSERMSNPALEARAVALYRDIRCVVCQNQAIIDSDAEIAKDLRALIRAQLAAGASDAEIIDYIHTRYGDFVLMRPPFQPSTWVLWLGPFMILLGGGLLAWRMMRREA